VSRDTDTGLGVIWHEARYVVHSQIALYLSLGWRIADDLMDTHHGDKAVLMVKNGKVDEEPGD